jgi:hypothetical protein
VNGIAPDTNLYPNAAQMFAEAQTLGANFVPEPSDTSALLLEWAGSSENVTIIELPPSLVEGADRFTAGGFIVRNGAKSNFGIRGGMHNGRLWGGITYLDQAAGVKVTGRACTSYMVVDTNCRRAVYDVSINGVAGTATVVVCDNGEPGRTDSVQITLSTGYSNGGVLGGGNKGGGNVQLHKPKPVSGKRSALGR